MMRTSFVFLLLLVLVYPAPAQDRKRPSGFGGGFKSGSPIPTSLPPLAGLPPMPAMSPPPAGLSGGFVHPGRPHRPPNHPGYPFYGVWQGFGGWAPFYGYPIEVPVPIEVPAPVPVPVGTVEHQVELSGEMPATLVLEFPAAAKVWVNGKVGEGEAQAEWTLTSPPIHIGTEYLFAVKARWTSNGRTFEHERTIAVAAGSRSRSLIISGKEIKE